MTGHLHHADRRLEVARELRAAAEETRRVLQAARDLVRRSREQSRLVAEPARPEGDDTAPSRRLVECLIEAYEAAEDETDAQTRQLLDHVLNHVGRRIAGSVGPKAAGVALN